MVARAAEEVRRCHRPRAADQERGLRVATPERAQDVEGLHRVVGQLLWLGLGVVAAHRAHGSTGRSRRALRRHAARELVHAVRGHRDAQRKGVPAAAQHQVRGHALHGIQDVDSLHAPSAALGGAVGPQRHEDGRLAVALGHLGGHDAHHAFVPPRVGHDDGARRGERGIRIDALARLLEEGLVHDPPLVIQLAERAHDGACPRRVIGDQELHGLRRVAEAADRVEPRPEPEADVRRIHALAAIELRVVEQRAHAHHLHGVDGGKPTRHEDAVLVDKRHHVRHGAERHQRHAAHQRVLEHRGHVLAAAPEPRELGRHLERHRRAAEIDERRRIASRERRVRDRRSLRLAARVDMVVIRDQELDAERLRMTRRPLRGRAAIDGDHHSHAVRRQCGQRFVVEPVALLDAVGHVEAQVGIRARSLDRPPQDGGGRDAVGVVIAVDGDAPAGAHRGLEALGHGRGAGERARRVQQVDARRVEKVAAAGIHRVLARRHHPLEDASRTRCPRSDPTAFDH